MVAINYSTLRNNLKTYMDQVTDDCETLIVTRKNGKNVIMISEEAYNNLMENIHLTENKENYDWLMESKAQLEKGMLSKRDLTEVPNEEQIIHTKRKGGSSQLAKMLTKDIKKSQ